MAAKKLTLFGVLFFLVLAYGFSKPRLITSIPPTSVKDTLSSSQLSFFARTGIGNTVNDTNIQISVGTTGNPSNTTHNLFVGDTIAIGDTNASTLTKYVVTDVGNTSTFQIGSGLASANAYAGLALIATRTAVHTLSLTPQSNETGGAWQFLLKVTSRVGESWNDGIPDQQGFDFGQDVTGLGSTGLGTRLETTDITCPWGATASVGTTVVVNSNSYAIIQCQLGAGITSAVGVGVTFTIGKDLALGSQLINPAPSYQRSVASEGVADTYTFLVRHLDAGGTLIDSDSMQGKIAVIESVRVTATVDPTLTFYIDSTNVGTGSTVCGNVGAAAFGTNAANTTGVSVAFGSLTLGSFNNLAQRLSCVTNADGGFNVTVYAATPMRNISDGTTIPNTACDAGTCTYSVGNTWTNTGTYGWGYTLQNVNANTIGVGSTSIYKPFGISATQATSVMSHTTTPTATEQAYICYRLNVPSTQQTGNYENQLIYTATATF